MAVTLDIRIEGTEQILRRMKGLPLKIENKIVRGAAVRGARQILATAKGLVPVLTGALKRGLKAKAFRKRRKGLFGRVVIMPTRSALGIEADDPYYYPAAVEYGHKIPGGGRVRAYPFLRPALERGAPAALEAFRSHLLQALNEAGR